ncbi:hypothetical protein OF83DRAFT_771021 [Amylostereum chailletii]|nr:hypothetical protein OF83DRAFT_771021 [Amylostereum chailletii]
MSNETPDGDTLLSPASSASQSPWPRPLSPIPPHRLAKLANALGISTPVPHQPARSLSDSCSTPRTADPWRSPTPSAASTSQFTTHSSSSSFQSRFLIHVIPPTHLPHDNDFTEALELTPPPTTASGYHTQFRRGTLVPLLPNLQSQLWAIAKEYALPSTSGLVLYLVTSAPSRNELSTPGLGDPEEPGPRLSEEIWKHLWMRVVKTERQESGFPSRSPTPNAVGLGIGFGGRSSPLSEPSSSYPLRPFVSNGRPPNSLSSPLTPSASTTSSSTSDPRTTAASSSEPSQSEVTTPDTSLPPESRADMLDLPGLSSSPSLIPILAKVEFDIDRRKAEWYGPWLRSRKMNHKKRGMAAREYSKGSEGGDDVGEGELVRKAPLGLKLVDRQAVPRFLLSAEEDEDDEPLAGESTGDRGALGPEGALEGNEEEDVEWHARNKPRLSVEIPPSPSTSSGPRTSPTTVTSSKKVPPPLTLAVQNDMGIIASAEPSPMPSTAASGKLAYLRDGDGIVSSSEEDVSSSQEQSEEDGGEEVDGEVDGDEEEDVDNLTFRKLKSPVEDKRGGAFFEDLDLGLEFEDSGEFDEHDPNDRRRSQYAMKAKLDEIERTLVQFSPRRLKHELEDSAPAVTPPRSASLARAGASLSPPLSAVNGRFPRTSTGSPKAAGTPGSPPKWPAVPYTSLNGDDDDPNNSLGLDGFPSPPKFALNGVSNAIPLSPYKQRFSVSSNGESEESKARKRELEGHEPTYPAIIPPSLRARDPASSSPVIPLSPDPFGRFPSEPVPPVPQRMSEDRYSHRSSSSQSRTTFSLDKNRDSDTFNRDDSMTSVSDRKSSTPSSRFSIDSADEHGPSSKLSARSAQGASLNPVKSIRTLWRKSRKSSISSTQTVAPAPQTNGRGSPQPPLPPNNNLAPAAMSRVSEEVVTNAMLPPGRRTPQGAYPDASLSTKALQRAHGGHSINSIHFDQESPYPVRRSAAPPTPPMPSRQPAYQNVQYTQAQRPSSTSSSPPPSDSAPLPSNEKSGARKSILKSWRSASTVSGSGSSPTSPPADSTGRPSIEVPDVGAAPARKRRPSVIEMVRGSLSIGSMGELPPSPNLPEQYAAANARRSQADMPGAGSGRFSVRSSVVNGRATPSGSSIASSQFSSRSSPPPIATPTAGGSPPPGSEPAVSRASQEDETFEIIDTTQQGHGKAPSLSYPYHELDHQAS